jgi:hypothetical protein
VQAGWSTVRFVDSINSCNPLEVEGEGDSCTSRLVNWALCWQHKQLSPLRGGVGRRQLCKQAGQQCALLTA